MPFPISVDSPSSHQEAYLAFVAQRAPHSDTYESPSDRDFKKERVARFFRNASRQIFGRRARNKSFCDRALVLAQKAPWKVLHFPRGACSRVVTPDPHSADIQAAAMDPQIGAKYQAVREWPYRSLVLGERDGNLLLPLVNDRGETIEFALPLDQYSAQQFKDLGFASLSKRSVRLTKPISVPDVEAIGECQESSLQPVKPNRRATQARTVKEINHKNFSYS